MSYLSTIFVYDIPTLLCYNSLIEIQYLNFKVFALAVVLLLDCQASPYSRKRPTRSAPERSSTGTKISGTVQ